MKKFKHFILHTFRSWKKDDAFTEAAALSFYTFLALPALFFAVLTIGSIFLDTETTTQELGLYSQGIFGASGEKIVDQLIKGFSFPVPPGKIFFSLVLVFFTASSIFQHLQKSLNKIWNVVPSPKKLQKKILNRGILFLFVFGLGLVFLGSLVVEASLLYGSTLLSQFLRLPWNFIPLIGFMVSFLVLSVTVMVVYKVLPAVKIAWRDVFVGAVITSVLVTLGNLLLGFYLEKSNLTSLYGAAGSILVIMVGIYYTSLVFFLGAEFTQSYANTYGSKILGKNERWYQRILRYVQKTEKLH